jgi:drug/metabolite transporter (DMT)-like permease
MTWLSVSFANMFFMVALRLAQKRFVSSSKMSTFQINWLSFAISLPVTLVIIVTHARSIEQLSVAFWLVLVAVVVGFFPAVNYLYFRVIRENELSDILPLFGLIPIFTAVFGWLFLGQTPAWTAAIGIVAVSVSIYVLHERAGKAWYQPLLALGSSHAARVMLVVSVITAIAAIGDKFAIQRSSTSMYMALNTTGAFIILAACDLIESRNQGKHAFRKEMAGLSVSQWKLLAVLGLVQLGTNVSSFAAVNISPNTSYTIAIRNLNIVVASLAAVLLFHERVNRYKLLSYGLSALGVVLIAL